MIEYDQETAARANQALMEAQNDPLFEVIDGWQSSEVEVKTPIFHGTGSLALFGSDFDTLLSLPGNTLSFSQSVELATIQAFKTGTAEDLVINSSPVLPYTKDRQTVLSNLGGSDRPFIWNDALYQSMHPDELKVKAKDLDKMAQDSLQEQRSKFLASFLRSYRSLTPDQREKMNLEIEGQYPVLITLEGDGLPLSDGRFVTNDEFPLSLIRKVEVPYSRVIEVEEYFKRQGLEVDVAPLEARELARIRKLAGFNGQFKKLEGENISASSVKLVFKDEIRRHRRAYFEMISAIASDAFGNPPKDVDDVLRSFDFLLIALENGEPVGFAGYRVENVPGIGKVLEGEGRAFRKTAQGKGHGGKITTQAISLVPDAKYLVFSTQNPANILSAKRALPHSPLFPIDMAYAESPQVLSDLERMRQYKGFMVESTGLKKHTYDGKLGDYEVDLAHPEIVRIEERLQELGLDRNAGDAVFIMARFSQRSN